MHDDNGLRLGRRIFYERVKLLYALCIRLSGPYTNCYAHRRYQVLRINMKYGMWLRAHISHRVIGN